MARVAVPAPSRPDAPPRRWRDDLLAVLPAWLVSRALVLLALAGARYATDRLPALDRVRTTLVAWDGGFYVDLARRGYDGVAEEASRFFPLYPGAIRIVDWVVPGGAAVAAVLVANVAALGFLVLLRRLVMVEWDDVDLARRTAWIAALAPGAFVLTMGYSEALFLVLVVGCFLALRTERFGVAAALAFAAGLGRPVGVLLAVPAAIEAARAWSSAPSVARLWRAGAVAAAPLGTLAYLVWTAVRTGDPLLDPIRLHEQANLRGETLDPIRALLGAASDAVTDGRAGPAAHLLAAVSVLVLAILVCRRLPLSYGLWSLAVPFVALTSRNLDSFERYALAAFPIAIVAAQLTASRRVEPAVVAGLAGAMTAYAVAAFLGVAVP